MKHSEWINLLDGKRKAANQYEAKCPAHADQHASLRINTAEPGKTLLHCHAGCTTEAVVTAVGKTLADLFTDAPQKPVQAPQVITTQPVAQYFYMDTMGRVQLEKRRYPGKKFRWFHMAEDGSWRTGNGGALAALFNVDEVQDKPGVFWVEGEKDVCTLMKHGLTAVCLHSGAAGKPTPEQLEPLRGKSVAILPDNDEPGRKHAQNVAMALQGIAGVRVLDLKQLDPDLPEKGDISDIYGKQGEGATEKLRELARTAQDWKPEGIPASGLVSLDGITPEPPRYFWEPYIRLHNMNIIRGDGGVGKTSLAFALAAAVTTGRMPDGMPGTLHEKGAVIYYGTEDDPADYAHKAKLCGCDNSLVHVVGEGSDLPELVSIDTFKQQIKDTGAKLIIFDPLQSFLGSGVDINKANEVRPIIDKLRSLCREMECTAIILEHMNKATQQKAHYRGIGTVDIINSSRSTIMVGWHPEQRGISVAIQIKANAKWGDPIAFKIDGEGLFSWRGTCDVTEDEVANARKSALSNAAADVVDPVLALVLALMGKYPDGWMGTASQMLAEGSALVDCSLITGNETIGRRLPGIHHELRRRGIAWRKIKRTHAFSKHVQAIIDGEGTVWTDSTDKTDINALPTVPDGDTFRRSGTVSQPLKSVLSVPTVPTVQEPPQEPTPREQAKTLYLQGKKYAEISETLGVKYKTVAKWKQLEKWDG